MDKTISRNTTRSMLAGLCIFLTISQANAQSIAPRTALHASRTVSQSIVAANGLFTGTRPTAEQLNHIADSLHRFQASARLDGSLIRSEQHIKAYLGALVMDQSTFREQNTDRITNALQANAWMGTREHVASMLSSMTQPEREALAQEIRENGIGPLLARAERGLRLAAAAIQQAQRANNPTIFPAAYRGEATLHLVNLSAYDCRVYEGSFKWVLAIGGVASLGGVDPLGDLLLAIGGVGEAVIFVLCP